MSAAGRCQFWLPHKRRHCANSSLPSSSFCGNHGASSARRVPCPLDPSHSVLEESLEAHLPRCPRKKLADALESQPYYSKGINAGAAGDTVSAAAKRDAILKLTEEGFRDLVGMIKSVHARVVLPLHDAYCLPTACEKWLHQQLDRRLPYQERHVMQQASILGNMELRGMLRKRAQDGTVTSEEGTEGPAVVEFGAGRGYLTQMLADCYEITRVYLIERRSYKLKADRSLRQNERIILDRLRIDIEDLNLNGIESLKGRQYVAIGKHLCGPATDMTIRCCKDDEQGKADTIERSSSNVSFQGLALATCCHHLCQWKHYINKTFLLNLGITEDIFHCMTWFSSWAVDGEHSCKDPSDCEGGESLETRELKAGYGDLEGSRKMMRSMAAEERAALGFICKDIIDTGRLMWLKDHGMDAELVKYVPSSVSPESHLLIAAFPFSDQQHRC